MGESLENVAETKIKTMFSKISDNKLVGVGIGLGTTAVIQSSSAVTVMLIGFVNSGLMTLLQATSIIYGANIGTTVTAQIVALGFSGIKDFNLSAIFAACAGVGAFMTMFSKKEKVVKIGGIITGLGMIFAGLALMTKSMSSFSDSETIVALINKWQNPMLLLLFGVFFTGLIQSSSAVSGLVITLAATGMIDFSQAMYIVVGSNIGTCVTAILSSIGTSTNAKRVAAVHFIFNLFGVIIFMLSDLFIDYANIFPRLFANNEALQIAMLHTYFNVVTTLIMLPLTAYIVKLATKIVKDKPMKENNAPHFTYIEEHILRTPPIAVAQLRKEILNMATIAKTNFDMAIDACSNVDISNKDTLAKNEIILNFLNREIVKFLVSLSHTDISHNDKVMIGTSYHTISDLERIGDYAENIMEYAEKMKADNLKFSEEALNEVAELKRTITALYDVVIKSYKEIDLKYLPEANTYEEQVDSLKEIMSSHHILRLSDGTCTPETGAIYLSLASNAERVADHLINIALAIKSYAQPTRKAVPPKPANANQ